MILESLQQQLSALTQSAGIVNLSSRSRLCLTGADRTRFLHGQVTNDIKRLKPGEGCYAALVTAKGKMQSDLNIYHLGDELLLDFEPGLSAAVTARLEKYIVADDVQVVDAAPAYGLVSVQGPRSSDVLASISGSPGKPFDWVKAFIQAWGETYVINRRRLHTTGFDLFLPNDHLDAAHQQLLDAIRTVGGCACGWEALEAARIAAGVPRFGVDMDETCFPQECGIETQAVSYRKGCYIGQEILNRIHALGHVNRILCHLEFPEGTDLPVKGDKIRSGTSEVGHFTSASRHGNRALGYVRREFAEPGAVLLLGLEPATPVRILGPAQP